MHQALIHHIATLQTLYSDENATAPSVNKQKSVYTNSFSPEPQYLLIPFTLERIIIAGTILSICLI